MINKTLIMPRKKQARQQNIKYDNQNTKYTNIPSTPTKNLRCFVSRQYLLQIYTLFGKLFAGQKVWWHTKKDKYQVCSCLYRGEIRDTGDDDDIKVSRQCEILLPLICTFLPAAGAEKSEARIVRISVIYYIWPPPSPKRDRGEPSSTHEQVVLNKASRSRVTPSEDLDACRCRSRYVPSRSLCYYFVVVEIQMQVSLVGPLVWLKPSSFHSQLKYNSNGRDHVGPTDWAWPCVEIPPRLRKSPGHRIVQALFWQIQQILQILVISKQWRCWIGQNILVTPVAVFTRRPPTSWTRDIFVIFASFVIVSKQSFTVLLSQPTVCDGLRTILWGFPNHFSPLHLYPFVFYLWFFVLTTRSCIFGLTSVFKCLFYCCIFFTWLYMNADSFFYKMFFEVLLVVLFCFRFCWLIVFTTGGSGVGCNFMLTSIG